MRPPLWLRAAAAITRRLPAGRYRASQAIGRMPIAPFVARMPHHDAGGVRFTCDLRDQIARDVFLAGLYEPIETQLLRETLRPGDTFVDVGANWGYFTLIAASLVNAQGRVIAVEADPRHYARLANNVALNHFSQVTCVHAAAARERGTLRLRGYADAAVNRGVSSLHASLPEDAPTFDVAAIPIDALLDDAGCDRVALMKIDVEGGEDGVLEGMQSGLARHRFARIMLELHPDILEQRDVSVREVCDRLRAHGYVGWSIDRAGRHERLAAYGRTPPRVALRRADEPDPRDRWPHMLWVAP
jgi:FkbM family methyltransferase